jgi:hypothetical protein
LTRQRLLKVKARALRRGVWFKALSRMERGVFDLTVRCVERVQSSVLAGMVSGIVAKLWKNLKPGFLDTAMRVGNVIAAEICDLALEWGNAGASFWRHDLGFTRFLGVSAVNEGRFEVYGGDCC